MSGAAHDMDHPGNNNMLEIKSRSKLAILYNDVSVLENHHAASLFFLLDNQQQDCDIYSNFTPQQRSDARKQIIDYILHTDMSKHA